MQIAAIRFPGRRAIPEADLVPALGALHVGGILNEELLQLAALKVSTVYWNRGYANVKTAEPRVVRHGATVDLELQIVEGDVYTIGTVRVRGAAASTPAPALRSGELFSRDRIADARNALETQLGEHWSVLPITKVDQAAHRIDITFEVTRT